MRQKYVCAAWFGLHFLLIISFSCRETLGLIARGLTIFPSSFKSFAQKAETVADAVLGQHLAASNAVRQALATYLHIAGIETGYSYFAPNVPAVTSSFSSYTTLTDEWNMSCHRLAVRQPDCV